MSRDVAVVDMTAMTLITAAQGQVNYLPNYALYDSPVQVGHAENLEAFAGGGRGGATPADTANLNTLAFGAPSAVTPKATLALSCAGNVASATSTPSSLAAARRSTSTTTPRAFSPSTSPRSPTPAAAPLRLRLRTRSLSFLNYSVSIRFSPTYFIPWSLLRLLLFRFS